MAYALERLWTKRTKLGAAVANGLMTALVSVLVLATSRPARDEYAEFADLFKNAASSAPFKTTAENLLAPDAAASAGWNAITMVAGIVSVAAGVFVLTHLLAQTSGVRRYAFNAVIDRRMGNQTLRFEIVANALPVSLMGALLLPGMIGMYCVLLFAVLFGLVRCARGEKIHVIIDPSRRHDGKP